MSITKKRTLANVGSTPITAEWGEAIPTPQVVAIVEVRHLGNYMLHLRFTDGHETGVDFAPFLHASQHPDVRKYLDDGQFARYQVEHGNLMWGDFDLLFPLADLYKGKV